MWGQELKKKGHTQQAAFAKRARVIFHVDDLLLEVSVFPVSWLKNDWWYLLINSQLKHVIESLEEMTVVVSLS